MIWRNETQAYVNFYLFPGVPCTITLSLHFWCGSNFYLLIPDHFVGVYIIVQDDKDEFPTNVAMLAAHDDATRCKLNLISTTFV
ncbi:hypothetical protein MKW92_047318 [Papaver armeniacum]|nr:hypothetical protein MKW92_047318 [Papaver armeniacum]